MADATKELQTTDGPPRALETTSRAPQPGIFSSVEAFELAQRMAKALSENDLVPDTYKGKLANCMMAINLANIHGEDPTVVMNNLHMIKGKPTWGSSYLICRVDKSGLFAQPLQFRYDGTEGTDGRGCVAWTVRHSGEVVQGPRITIGMAKADGWFDRPGSKWKVYPDQMLGYRAGTFFARLHASSAIHGFIATEEAREMKDVSSEIFDSNADAVNEINKKIRENQAAKKAVADPVVLPPEPKKPEPKKPTQEEHV